MTEVRLKLFRVLRVSDRTRIDTDGEILGWGIEFPNGQIFVDWNREAFPEDDRLEEPHVSIYGTLADVEQGTGGSVDVLLDLSADGTSGPGSLKDALEGSDIDSQKLYQELQDVRERQDRDLPDHNPTSDPLEW